MPPEEYPTSWEADVLLRSGRPVHLRPITPDDGEALRAFHRSLSDRTVYYRFFAAKPELTDHDVHYFTEVDYDRRVALVALDAGEFVAVGRFDAVGDGSAEVAFVIRDDIQGQGLGSVLLEHLAAAARERGIGRFVAEVLPENHRMLATFREAGYEVRQTREEDVLAVSFDIEPTTESLAVTSAREHRAEARSVQRLLHPERVAVVGVRSADGGLGREVLRHIVEAGFTGDLVAVLAGTDEIDGVRCVGSLQEAAGPIDLAVIVVPADQVSAVVRDAAEARVHALVIVSGGFGDTGGEGPTLQAELVSMIRGTGMRLVGPNALGLINTDPAVRINASLVERMPPAGRVGFFSQSGALGGSILDRLRDRGVGVSTFVSAGNRADISGNDLLQYWEEDPQTDVVMLYLETIGNARKFARIIRRLSETKPVVMVRTGGAGQRHPLGHAVRSTLLSQRAVNEILGDCGLMVVDSIGDMIDVARIASTTSLPSGGSVSIIGNSDALAVMALNAIQRTSLTSAGPPMTFARLATPEAYDSAVRAALADPSVGSVLAIHVPPIEDPSEGAIRDVLRRCAIEAMAPQASAGGARKPVVAVMPHRSSVVSGQGASVEVPVFRDVEDALRSLAVLARYAGWRDQVGTESGDEGPVGSGVHDAIPAVEAGRRQGAEAVALGAGLGVAVTLGERTRGLGLRIHLIDDPLFGPVISVAADDPVSESLDETSYRLAPVSASNARRMLAGLATWHVVSDDADCHPDLLADASALLCSVSMLPTRLPQLTMADLRHVTWREGEPTVVDMSLTVTDHGAGAEPSARRL